MVLFSSTLLAQARETPPLNPTGRQLELQTPVETNGTFIGELLVRIGTDDAISMAADSLLSLLEPRVVASGLAALKQQTRDGRLGIDELSASGIDARFDQSRLTLVLNVPATLRRVLLINFGREAGRRTLTDQPEAFSAFVNLFAGVSRFDSGNAAASGDDSATQRLDVDLEGLVRYRGPVLAWEGTFRDSDDDNDTDTGFARRGTRLLIDRPQQSTRLTVGDIYSTGRLFQAPVDLLGVGFGSDFALSPGRNVRPTGQQQFVIERVSNVDVVVDGVTRRRLRLEPGAYDLRDLPLESGSNNVELVITDDAGQTETIVFSALYDDELLAPGTFDYAVYAGVLADSGGGSISYDEDEPLFTGYFNTGLRPWLTGGLNAQLTEHAGQIGLELLSATPVGPARLDLGLSDSRERGTGAAIGLSYQSIGSDDFAARRYGFGAQYRTEPFDGVEPGDDDAFDIDDFGSRLILDVGYGQRLSTDLFGTAGVSRSSSYGGQAASTTWSAAVSGTLGLDNGLAWSARARLTRGDDTTDDFDVSLGFTYRFDRVSSYYGAAYSDEDALEFGYRRQVDISRPGGYSVDVALAAEHAEDLEAEGRFGYTGNRFRSSFSHENRTADLQGSSRINATSARFETSLAIAGDAVALGRPVGESFAIVRAHPSLADRVIRLNPDADGESARSSAYGPALQSDLGLYSVKGIQYDVENLPLGYDLGSGLFVLEPPLGGGYRLQVGSGATVTVIGVLVDQADGSPLSLVSGKAVPVDEAAGEPVSFFSNRIGKFAISGLKPGAYDLQFATRPARSARLVITEDQSALMRLDTLEVP